MASKVSEAIRGHHRELLNTLSKQVAALTKGPPEARPQSLCTFLKEELLPHAVGEERHLYPAVDPLIKTYGKATATMSVDHEFIGTYIRQIEETMKALQAAPSAERSSLEVRLNHLALQLEAVFRLHLEKEERVYLPLFERHLSEREQEKVLEGMHAAHQEGPAPEGKATLDVRPIPPRERHPSIFKAFDALRAGEAFVLVNDHDPKPLYYQFKAEREGEFTWDYLQQGPDVWRVRIGRVGQTQGREGHRR